MTDIGEKFLGDKTKSLQKWILKCKHMVVSYFCDHQAYIMSKTLR